MGIKLIGNAENILTVDKKIEIEWNKANMFQLSILDENGQRKAARIIQMLVAENIYDNTISFVQDINLLDELLDNVWVEYYTNKTRIISGLSPLPYTIPSYIPQIDKIVSEYKDYLNS